MEEAERRSGTASGALYAAATPRSSALRILVAGLLLAALVLLARSTGDPIPRFAAWVASLGPVAPLVFAGVYAIAVVALVPASVLTLAAGAIFGVAKGTAIVFVAATLGACLAFLLARFLARGAVEHWIAGQPRFAAVDRAVAREGRRIVLLLRLSPVFPFGLLNYALGLTRVRFVDYAIACLGMLPGTLLYVYTGSAFGLAAAALGGAGRTRTASEWTLFGVGLVATLVATVLVTRVARRALAEATA